MNNESEILRHSMAHLLASAVVKLFPDAKLGIGPAIENGFYYDFDLPRKLTDEDLPVIEAAMKKIAKTGEKFTCKEISKKEAKEMFKNQPYKLELIDELPGDSVSTYTNGNFTDLCKGPHTTSAGKLAHFKLTRLAGAYWRGDEKRPMLQRVYGIGFATKEELDKHIKTAEEAAQRDHRKLGVELDLFSIDEDCGPGLSLWHPKGGRLRKTIEDWIKNENIKRNYEMVYSPHIARLHLWETSGHTSFYNESMFQPIEVEKDNYQLKPMNCPFHILIYKNKLRSYRDLPMRLAELGTVYRYERSGVLHGLLRVRGFTQDDAHIFCSKDQINAEIADCLDFARHIFAVFGFKDYKIELSTRDEAHADKYVGDKEHWEMAQTALEEVLKKNNMAYSVSHGEAAFYGPKIDIKVIDAIGRPWQLSTIQFDFNLPERFNLEYVSDKGRERPLMVHRALLGSVERFTGILIEHYAGLFPLWLAPVQAKVLTLTSNEENFAREVCDKMKHAGLRVEIDARPEKIGMKIRQAHLEKIPYSIVIGAKEAESKTLTVRLRNAKNISGLSVDEVIATMLKEVETYSVENLYK